MYIVMEIQKSTEGTLAWLVTQYDNWNDAVSKYHTILAAAAKSGLPRHSASILSESGSTLVNESYGEEV